MLSLAGFSQCCALIHDLKSLFPTSACSPVKRSTKIEARTFKITLAGYWMIISALFASAFSHLKILCSLNFFHLQLPNTTTLVFLPLLNLFIIHSLSEHSFVADFTCRGSRMSRKTEMWRRQPWCVSIVSVLSFLQWHVERSSSGFQNKTDRNKMFQI